MSVFNIKSRQYYRNLYDDLVYIRAEEVRLPEDKKTLSSTTFKAIEKEIFKIKRFMGWGNNLSF